MNKCDKLARILWNYLQIKMTPEKSDVILVLGNYDLNLAKRAFELYITGYAPLVVFTGNMGKVTQRYINKPESEILAEEAIKLGIPFQKILIEKKSTNTRENIEFAQKILSDKKIKIDSYLLVSVPYMERRGLATFEIVMPNIKASVTSPQISFEEDMNNPLGKELTINLMVGYVDRIKIYGKCGWQTPQEIPSDVYKAYQELLKLGYDKHLVK